MSRDYTRREMLATSAAAAMAVTATAGRAQTDSNAPESSRPLNVLYINTDQQRWDALSCAGSSVVQTPGVDRLAREGTRFTYAITPQPMCTAARTALMTGLSIYTTGCVAHTRHPDMNFHNGTFDQNLAKAGYRVEYHGRYHSPMALVDAYANPVDLEWRRVYWERIKVLGDPPPVGEGQAKNIISNWPYNPDPTDFNYRTAHGNPPAHGVDGVNYGVDTTPPEFSYSAFVADETIDALKRNKDRPFCITAAFLHPHHPIYVPETWADSVKPKDIPPPRTMHHKRENTPYADWQWQIDEVDIEHISLIQARYYQSIQETDHHIGRVLQALDDLGLSDNTLVIFWSDHGEFMGDHGLMQKFLPYDESIRVPYILRLPGRIPAGKTVDHTVNCIDTFATIFDYAGLECPKQEGRSLRPVIEGGKPESEYTFTEMTYYTCFTSQDWKYVWSTNRNEMDVLFNLREDPQELTNLLGNHPDRAKYVPQAEAVRKEMLGWMESINHPLKDAVQNSEIG